jgi:hypothetical protein
MARMMNQLYRHNQTISQWSIGGAYLYPLYEMGPYKLILGVECEFLALEKKQMALLDTAAELSIVDNVVYQTFLDEPALLGPAVGTRRINTRLGNFDGTLYRVEVGLKADWGEDLVVEGTFLFCKAWKGPTVLGFGGFLERIRFAIDPDYEKIGCIYFSAT